MGRSPLFKDERLVYFIDGRRMSSGEWAASPANPFPPALRPMPPDRALGRLLGGNPLKSISGWRDPANFIYDVPVLDELRARARAMRAFREHPAPGARTRTALECPEHVARDARELRAVPQLRLDIRQHGPHRVLGGDIRGRASEDPPIDRAEQRRILMVISDGAPVDDSTLSANPGNYLERHLRHIIEEIETRSPVELIAIGIGHDVTRYYRRAVTIVDAEELAGAMTEQLASLFGEETAMLEALDGRPPFPRIAPPFRRGVDEVVAGGGEGLHVGAALVAAGFQRRADRDVLADHGHAAVARRIAIAVAVRTRRASFRQGPGRLQVLAGHAGQHHRIGLAGRAQAVHGLLRDIHQGEASASGIDDGPADIEFRGPRHGQQGRRDQTAGRGLCDGDRLASGDQKRGDAFGEGVEVGHHASFVGTITER